MNIKSQDCYISLSHFTFYMLCFNSICDSVGMRSSLFKRGRAYVDCSHQYVIYSIMRQLEIYLQSVSSNSAQHSARVQFFMC